MPSWSSGLILTRLFASSTAEAAVAALSRLATASYDRGGSDDKQRDGGGHHALTTVWLRRASRCGITVRWQARRSGSASCLGIALELLQRPAEVEAELHCKHRRHAHTPRAPHFGAGRYSASMVELSAPQVPAHKVMTLTRAPLDDRGQEIGLDPFLEAARRSSRGERSPWKRLRTRVKRRTRQSASAARRPQLRDRPH
mgnify:CR=1 FL=1